MYKNHKSFILYEDFHEINHPIKDWCRPLDLEHDVGIGMLVKLTVTRERDFTKQFQETYTKGVYTPRVLSGHPWYTISKRPQCPLH